ncbi:protein HOTHEAD-like [Curcuma longa]|uniref:protein HOTHEAD-like n=1 Tax=Curcuma longa TaxID=136217 RepID=UPI003D9F1533
MGFAWLGLLTQLSLLFFFGCCDREDPNYTFVKHSSGAPPVSYHDYIVVGGGTAGCPMAATLSQGSDVLVLERGGSPYGNRNISDLASMVDNLADLSPDGPVQRFVSEDGVINARARVLGGASCINAGFYSRASAQEVESMGWDATLVRESYEWVEKVVAFEARPVNWTAALKDALVEAGVTPDHGFTYEHLNGTKIGASIFDPTGHRHTAADLLRYANPRRLTVLLRATVHRILFQKKRGGSRVRAHGVIYKDALGKKHRAYLKGGTGEVIVAAGALGSPQLLMLSGIGPADHLKSLGIKVVVDQPLVGQGMSDNPTNAVVSPSQLPVDLASVQVVGISPLGFYVEHLTGFNLLPALSVDPTNSPVDERASQVVFGASGEDDTVGVTFQGGLIVEKVARPLSRGYLKLKNLNPNENPSVTFNYFAEPEDVAVCVESLKTIQRAIQSEALAKYRSPDLTIDDLVDISANLIVNERPRQVTYNSTNLDQYCKDVVLTIWHYHGGCQVGQVVDGEHKVHGVDALRVIDGSTFSFSPGTNPQATVMMMGRYMGLKLLNKRLGRKNMH